MKCINCIHYKENPEFDYYDNPTWYAKCEKEREDIFEGDLEGVYQDALGYGGLCKERGLNARKAPYSFQITRRIGL